jgi:serine phosphatase RsbU (regulator of sigma subunit)/CHASE2 domain-containing sensor protein
LRDLARSSRRAAAGRLVALAVLAAAVVLLLGPDLAAVAALRGAAFDTYQRLAPRQRVSAPVVIVEIDDASLAEYGQWPWPRTALARLLETIAEGGPAAIGVDIVMPEADRLSPDRLAPLVSGLDPGLGERLRSLPASDPALGATVARRHVVLAMIAVDAGLGGIGIPMRYTPARVVGGSARGHVRTFSGVLRSIDAIDAGAAGRGLVNAAPEERVVRRLPVVAAVGDVLVPSLGVEMLRVVAGEPAFTVRAGPGGVSAVEVGGVRVPTQRDGTAFVSYGRADPARYVSAADLLSGRIEARRLERKLVLVGVTAVGLGDAHVTPLALRVPGVEIHAQWLESVFDGRLLLRPSWAPWAEAAALLVGGAVLVLALPSLPTWGAVLVILVLLALSPVTGFLVYLRGGLLLDAASPAVGTGMVAVTMILAMVAEAQRQQRILREQVQAQREEAARVGGELEAARRIQMGILPTGVAGEDRVAVYAFLQPARVVGGDLYDFFKLDADRLFFVVADVSGHGVAASLFMAVSKALCKSAALRRGDDLGAIIRDAHADISRDNPEALFVSVWAGLLDLRTGELQHCNAGHEPAWLVGPDAGVARVLEDRSGPPLCVVDGYPYVALSHSMRPGETICLVTDGVTEAEDAARSLYGRQRLAETLARAAGDSPGGLGEAIRYDVTSFMSGTLASDDLTILVLRWQGAATASLRGP